MASFRKYVKKNGEITINVEIRKKGFSPLYQAFSGTDEKTVKADAKAWAQETEARMYYKRFNDPRAADFSLQDAFRKYFVHAERTKSVKTIRREKDAEKQILELLGPDTPLNKITRRTVAEYRDTRLDSYVTKRYLKKFAWQTSWLP
jgi:hypothetical protein